MQKIAKAVSILSVDTGSELPTSWSFTFLVASLALGYTIEYITSLSVNLEIQF